MTTLHTANSLHREFHTGMMLDSASCLIHGLHAAEIEEIRKRRRANKNDNKMKNTHARAIVKLEMAGYKSSHAYQSKAGFLSYANSASFMRDLDHLPSALRASVQKQLEGFQGMMEEMHKYQSQQPDIAGVVAALGQTAARTLSTAAAALPPAEAMPAEANAETMHASLMHSVSAGNVMAANVQHARQTQLALPQQVSMLAAQGATAASLQSTAAIDTAPLVSMPDSAVLPTQAVPTADVAPMPSARSRPPALPRPVPSMAEVCSKLRAGKMRDFDVAQLAGFLSSQGKMAGTKNRQALQSVAERLAVQHGQLACPCKSLSRQSHCS